MPQHTSGLINEGSWCCTTSERQTSHICIQSVNARYSHIERELLNVVFGMERLHHYIFGRKIKILTDPNSTYTHIEEIMCNSML